MTYTQRRADENARNIFKRKNEGTLTTTLNVDQPPKELARNKGISNMIFSQVLKTDIAYMIDHWLKINEVEEFKRRIHTTIKDIYINLQKKEQSPVIVG